MRTRTITICALMVALLISVQFCLSFVSGVELVTVLFVSFCYVFGARKGVIVATVFSIIRCIVFGAFINVIILYLIYYNIVAVVFGLLNKHKTAFRIIVPLLLLCIAILCAVYAIGGIPISIIYKTRVSVMLWILFGICVCILISYTVLCFISHYNTTKDIVIVIALAVGCTVFFTMLDDVITPFIYGYSFDVAIGYFYTSFLALLPQTISVFMSVAILFYPLKKAMQMFCKDDRKMIAPLQKNKNQHN